LQQKLKGSGGYVIAEITPEQAKKADLGVDILFLTSVGKIEETKISKYYCNVCQKDYEGSPKLSIENPNEKLGEQMILKEIGQYLCSKCNGKIGEYREFLKLVAICCYSNRSALFLSKACCGKQGLPGFHTSIPKMKYKPS